MTAEETSGMIIAPGDGSSGSERRDATFTGEVWATPVVSAPGEAMIASIFFAPGARTFWHSHDGGQVLQVLAGSGLVGRRGEPPRALRAGDTVWAPPGEVHWHGASAGTALSHLAISLGTTRWAEPVAAAADPAGLAPS
jgi:quercetin dioxygenase-like cupin family protein